MENEYDLSLRISLSAYFCFKSVRYCSYDFIFYFKEKMSRRYYSIDFYFFLLPPLDISFLYYFGPSGNVKYRFISAGSSLATVFIILVSWGFAFYVNNFGSYNKLYGSIGTIIVVMLFINFNVFVVLLGYELNSSIFLAKKKQYANRNKI